MMLSPGIPAAPQGSDAGMEGEAYTHQIFLDLEWTPRNKVNARQPSNIQWK